MRVEPVTGVRFPLKIPRNLQIHVSGGNMSDAIAFMLAAPGLRSSCTTKSTTSTSLLSNASKQKAFYDAKTLLGGDGIRTMPPIGAADLCFSVIRATNPALHRSSPSESRGTSTGYRNPKLAINPEITVRWTPGMRFSFRID
jgi:hypothetical protein